MHVRCVFVKHIIKKKKPSCVTDDHTHYHINQVLFIFFLNNTYPFDICNNEYTETIVYFKLFNYNTMNICIPYGYK